MSTVFPQAIRGLVALAALVALPFTASAAAADEATRPADPPVLAGLIEDSLAHRPELLQARSVVEAGRERIPQAGALPDPTLTLGIQNDGFGAIQIGEMETSYWLVMLTQPFYFPGKQALREKVAELEVDASKARLLRLRLTTEADVRRAFVELLLVRERLQLLSTLEGLWEASEKLAKARYASGQAGQSDLLRAQLERIRLRQQRTAFEAIERTRVQELNRLAGRPLDGPIETGLSLSDLPDPMVPGVDEAMADAKARSPELREARATVQRASSSVALARKERLPDFSVSGGVMPRGDLEPMWQLSVGVTLPIWSGSKQNRAVAENVALERGAKAGVETVEQLLRLRTESRIHQLRAALETLHLYREGLLVQAEATTRSTLAGYQVGSLPFASVLEALNAYVEVENGALDAAALAQRFDIAQREVSLEASETPSGSMSTGSVPGAGAQAGAATAPATDSPAAPSSGGGSMSRM